MSAFRGACRSAGRSPPLQGGGPGFKSQQVHSAIIAEQHNSHHSIGEPRKRYNTNHSARCTYPWKWVGKGLMLTQNHDNTPLQVQWIEYACHGKYILHTLLWPACVCKWSCVYVCLWTLNWIVMEELARVLKFIVEFASKNIVEIVGKCHSGQTKKYCNLTSNCRGVHD